VTTTDNRFQGTDSYSPEDRQFIGQTWARRFSTRFRQVANGFPAAVRVAYGGDIQRAWYESDEVVLAKVAAFERASGLPARDWVAIGRDVEGRGEDELA
jgi:hypothetical protein